jgi:hypothetical protein
MKDIFTDMIVDIEVVRGGEVIYRHAGIAGLVGVLTGMKPGAFSVSINERDRGTIWDNFLAAAMGY